MKFRILFLFITLLISHAVLAQNINSESSEVKFKVDNIGINTVKGNLKGMKGNIHFDVNNLKSSNFNVCVDVNTIKTGIGKRDEHLKSDDFFDAEEYPTICFESHSISKKEDGFETTGNLSLHGITKTVSIPFNFDGNKFVGTLIINRLDYKVGEDISTFTAGNEIKIEIICVVN